MDPEGPSSWQDVLKESREGETYVGRARELTLFNDNLKLHAGRGRKLVLDVFGPSGVGKSTLLQRFAQSARDAGFPSGWSDENEPDVPAMLGKMAQDFDGAGRPLKKLAKECERYRERRQQLESTPGAPNGFRAFMAHAAVQVIRRAPGVGLAIDIAGEGLTEEVFTEFANRVFKNSDDVRLVKEPVDVLTPIFLQEIRQVAEDRSVVLFFDSVEATAVDFHRWLRELVKGRHGSVPVALVLVLAGEEPMSRSDWRPFRQIIEWIDLPPFTEQEAREYLELKGCSEEEMGSIIALSGGLPMWVATLEEARQGVSGAGDLLEAVLGPLDASRREVVADGALPRRLNRDVVAVMVGEETARAQWPWMLGLRFVVARGDWWAYLGAARALLLPALRRESPKDWETLHGKLAGYFEERAAALGLEGAERFRQEDWRALRLEALYHWLCQAPRGYLPDALNGFVEAFAERREFARSFAQAVTEAGADADAEELGEWGARLSQGISAIQDKRYSGAIPLWTALIETGKLDQANSARARDWRGYLHYLLDDHEAALADLDEAVRLAPEEPEYLEDRALTAFQLSRFDNALGDLDRVLQLDPTRPNIYTLRGTVHQLAGHSKEAIADLTEALVIDPKDARALGNRGWAHFMEKEFDAALADFHGAEAIDQTVSFYPLGAGMVRFVTQQWGEAAADLARAAERDPGNPAPPYMRALALQRLLRIDDAAALLESMTDESIAALIEQTAAGLRMAPVAVERNAALFGQGGKAGARFLELASSDREGAMRVVRAEIRAVLASRDLVHGNADQAMNGINEAIELDPDEAGYRRMRAEMLMPKGQLDKALEDADRAVELDPSADAFLTRCRVKVLRQDDVGALEDIEHAVELAPDNLAMRFHRVQLLQQAGKREVAIEELVGIPDQAIRAFLKLVRVRLADVQPEQVQPTLAARGIATEWAVLLLATLAMPEELAIGQFRTYVIQLEAGAARGRGQPEDAMALLDRAIQVLPPSAWFHLARSEFRREAGDAEGALADLDEAAALDPEDTSSYRLARLRIFREQKDLQGALAEMDSAVAKEPEEDWWRYERALAHLALGHREAAATDLAEAIGMAQARREADPKNATNAFNLALYHLAAGDETEARELYAKTEEAASDVIGMAIDDLGEFLGMIPDHAPAKEIREELEGRQPPTGGGDAPETGPSGTDHVLSQA